MHRYTFYILTALLTFGISSFVALNLYWKSQEKSQPSVNPEVLNKLSGKYDFKETFPRPFDPSKTPQTDGEKPTKPFCNDKNILPVWKELVKSKSFQDWEPNSYQSLDCKDMLELRKIDLNQDGQKEIILRGNNSNLCSVVGNCGFWIYEKKKGKYKNILYETDYIDATDLPHQILKTKTNRYYDILLKGHLIAPDTDYFFYKFDGKNYKLSKHLVKACIVCVGDNPKWKLFTWKEYKKLNR